MKIHINKYFIIGWFVITPCIVAAAYSVLYLSVRLVPVFWDCTISIFSGMAGIK